METVIRQEAHHPKCEESWPQLEDVDELTARAFGAFRRMMHVNRLLMHRMVIQKGKHHGEMFALARLAGRDGLSQRELGEVLHLSAPRVSSILDSLEKSGAVLRRVDPEDRRLTRVFVTEAGRRRQREHLAVVGEYVNKTIGSLSESDRVELERLLRTLADKATEVMEEDTGESGPGERVR